MELKLDRKFPKETYCVGRLYINGEFFCNTLENAITDINKNGVFDGDEKKVYGHSSIPFGKYTIVYNYSPKFKRNLPRLLDVPHFDGILIHPGTTASSDPNEKSDTAGCILVGNNTSPGKLTNSRATSDKLNALIEEAQNNKEEITIEIV